MHPRLPDEILAHYRVATDNEVRAESFGLLRAAIIHVGDNWRNQRGTFDDQAIFGPRRDFECACGQYIGRDDSGIICDQCGVKVTASEVRRRRCAHINLSSPIVHSFSEQSAPLTVIPVLPAAFVEDPGGADLLEAYGAILRGQNPQDLSDAFGALLTRLAPLLILAHRSDLPERRLIAHGMALREPAG
jgi:hypothetical protein